MYATPRVLRRLTRIKARVRPFLNTIRPRGMVAAQERMSTHANGTSQTTRALLRLRELLLSGEFEPGARMSELPLVERLGVSRTPLRLALNALEHEGLLRLLPGGGYVVREFT